MIRAALVSLALFTVITGVVYPVIVTGIAQLVFTGRDADGNTHTATLTLIVQ